MEAVLAEPVSALQSVGPQRMKLLAGMGISTINDLLLFFPRKYTDRRDPVKVRDLVPGRPSVVFAEVESIERRRLRKPGLELVVADMSDDTGAISVSWFNRKGLEYVLKEGTSVALYGVPSLRAGVMEMPNPEFEVIKGEDDKARLCGITPIYPATAGLPVRWFRRLVADVVEEFMPYMTDALPPQVIEKRKFMPYAAAVRVMHSPNSPEEWKSARHRLAYEELFTVQAAMALRRAELKSLADSPAITPGKIYDGFVKSLPFELTGSQKDGLAEIFADTSTRVPMSRLLQGDVGSGKTLVAVGLAAAAADSGAQTAVMAPTEVLADQLYSQMEHWLSPLGVTVALLKGVLPAPAKRKVLASITDGSADVMVGTQSLLDDSVEFKNLGAVVIDEQHRFGVMQRAKLTSRPVAPHMLLMSATPIPRTLTMCYFGDLDISVLKDKPAGRKKIETRIVDTSQMKKLLQFIIDEAQAGGRAYWICPRVEDDGESDAVSSEKRFEYLDRRLSVLGVGLLHGRMNSAEKDETLENFRTGKIKILVGTTVVEVGVDVPEASVIVVESPEFFGLSQLHQLRGRVGRGARRGVCVLLTRTSADVPERLGVMLNTDDGFEIAEADLVFRGTGEISGAAQHGAAEFKIADLSRDAAILIEAKDDARELAENCPEVLKLPPFSEKLEKYIGNAIFDG
ncbi:MAG: ATP-dependent DNA helicase RecG [Synergistaceae bacterium]|nr:ATP-dependent DNA helicase RecG [Synergistaceae bacterium]